MDSRPVNQVNFFSPKYMPPQRDAKQEKKKKTETKRNHKSEFEDTSSEDPLHGGLGSQIDTTA